jgi:mevalonate kinase
VQTICTDSVGRLGKMSRQFPSRIMTSLPIGCGLGSSFGAFAFFLVILTS